MPSNMKPPKFGSKKIPGMTFGQATKMANEWVAEAQAVPEAAPETLSGQALGNMQNDMDAIKVAATKFQPGNWKGFESQHWNNTPKKAHKSTEPSDRPQLKLLKIGADVEEFLRDSKGNPVPVMGLIGGTKEQPMPILTSGYALQEDNAALEYNIPPAASVFDFVYSLMRIREEINLRVAKQGLSSAIEASMRFTEKQLDHPQAKVFGCDPDFNVWEQTVNAKPTTSPDSATLRTAGGHVHVSFMIGEKSPQFPDNLTEAETLIMALDLHLGVPFSIMDTDMERRKMYGKAGAFRPKPYGVEYRVLSNFWTRSPKLMGYVYQQVEDAIFYINRSKNPRSSLLEYKDAVYKAINEGDIVMAKELMRYFSIKLPSAE